MFLPLTLLGFGLLSRAARPAWVKLWLIAASLVFYSWLYPPSIVLLCGSILFNYALSSALRSPEQTYRLSRKALLTIGVAGNLVLLGYFKYRNFFLENLGLAAISLD